MARSPWSAREVTLGQQQRPLISQARMVFGPRITVARLCRCLADAYAAAFACGLIGQISGLEQRLVDDSRQIDVAELNRGQVDRDLS